MHVCIWFAGAYHSDSILKLGSFLTTHIYYYCKGNPSYTRILYQVAIIILRSLYQVCMYEVCILGLQLGYLQGVCYGARHNYL